MKIITSEEKELLRTKAIEEIRQAFEKEKEEILGVLTTLKGLEQQFIDKAAVSDHTQLGKFENFRLKMSNYKLGENGERSVYPKLPTPDEFLTSSYCNFFHNLTTEQLKKNLRE